MSLQVTNIKKQKLNAISCLFCDGTDNLVNNPKPQSFLFIQRAADRRKDDISEKIIQTLLNTNVHGIELVWQVILVKRK